MATIRASHTWKPLRVDSMMLLLAPAMMGNCHDSTRKDLHCVLVSASCWQYLMVQRSRWELGHGWELGLLLDGVELGIVDRLVLGKVNGFKEAALGTDDGDLLGLDKEGLELGSDDGDSLLAISDGPKESLGVGAWLGLELGLMLDGVELGTVNGLVLGTFDGFNNDALARTRRGRIGAGFRRWRLACNSRWS